MRRYLSALVASDENYSDIVDQRVQGEISGRSEEHLLEKLIWPDRSVEAITEFCMPNA